MRKLPDVLKKIIPIVQNEGLKDSLSEILESVEYASPEMMQEWWTEAQHEIAAYCAHRKFTGMSDPNMQPWERNFMEIWTDA